ncbi:MAG: hypothetical protein H6Q69_4326 [Firmicutes bacterium]|nr:hypothetical protein [Bacillota bacterium]
MEVRIMSQKKIAQQLQILSETRYSLLRSASALGNTAKLLLLNVIHLWDLVCCVMQEPDCFQ